MSRLDERIRRVARPRAAITVPAHVVTFSNSQAWAKPGAIDSLATLRGLAAAWVVIYHFQGDLYGLFPVTALLRPLFDCGNMAVPLFFILSGYVLSYNYAGRFATIERRQYLRFVLLRLARIYPVHLATLLGVLLMVGVSRAVNLGIDEHGYSARDFLLNLLLAHTWVPNFRLNWNYPSWSISSEWFAYLCFPLVCVAVNRVTTRRAALALTAACFLLMQSIAWFSPRLPFKELLAVVGTFLTDCALARLLRVWRGGEVSPRFPIWMLLAVGLVPFVLTGSGLTAVLLALFAALIYGLAVLQQSCPRIWLFAPLVFSGEVSYSLYMTHTLVQKVTNELLPSALFVSSSAIIRLMCLIFYLLLISGVTLLTYFIIERPYRRYLKVRLQTNAI
ncbi:MAG: acyltransferase [Acidobacteriota bacterium]